MAGLLLRKAATALRLAGRSPREFFRRLAPRVEVYEIVCTPVTREHLNPPLPGLTFRRLTDAELLFASRSREEFAPAKELFEMLGRNCAYGAFLDGTLVAMAWMIPFGWAPPEARLLKLNEAQAEGAQLMTLPEFRGKGIMPWLLTELNDVAMGMGIKEFLSLIAPDNAPSLRSSEKAGGRIAGRIYRLVGPPFLGFRQWVIRREIGQG